MEPIVVVRPEKVAVSGWAGTGKSTISKHLAKLLGYKFNSAGNYFRRIAKREKITLRELEGAAMSDPKYDLEVDGRTASYGRRAKKPFVFEGRVAPFMIPDSFKVFFVCDWDTRIKRIAQRDGISFGDAWSDTIHREESARERYHTLYGIKDITDENHYDLVIDTALNDIDKCVAIIVEHLSKLSSAAER